MDDTTPLARAADRLDELNYAERWRRRIRDWRQELFRSGGGKGGPWYKRIRISTIIALIVITLGVAGRASDNQFVEWVRVTSLDVYQKLWPREPVGQTQVGIIDIDEKSLAEIGQWPWSRTVIADILNKLADAKAGVIGFDVIFSEHDRTSPDRIASVIRGADPETIKKLEALPSNESVMAAAMKRMPTVIGQAGSNDKRAPGAYTASTSSTIKGHQWDSIGSTERPKKIDPKPFLHNYLDYLGSVPELEKAAAGHGFFSIANEPDGIVRRVPLIAQVDGKQIRPALTLEMLRVATGGTIIFTKQNFAGLTNISLQSRQGNFNIPVDRKGRIYVHFAKPDDFNTETNTGRLYISATDILHDRVPKERLAGKILLFGTSAVGLLDIRATPVSGRQPGVEVHANILETILDSTKRLGAAQQEILDKVVAEAKASGEKYTNQDIYAKAKPLWDKLDAQDYYLRELNIADSIEMALMLGAGLFMTILIPRLGPFLTLTGILSSGAVLLGASVYMYHEYLLLFDVIYPGAVTILLYSVLTFGNYIKEAQDKKAVRLQFAQYLSPALVEQLAEDPSRLKLGGETKDMTFLFCDVRGFTTISESFKANPQGLTVLINRLLTPLTDAILVHKGTIDKYMGDCIMAFWNAPVDDGTHQRDSCAAALDMMKELEALNVELKQEAEEEGKVYNRIDIGIGINSGECVVGNMGSRQRFDYSVLGDAVNLAARLEGQSKSYGVNIILGPETTAESKEQYAILELDLITVKGKTEAVDIYALLGDKARADSDGFKKLEARHNDYIAAYRAQRWDDAIAISEECKQLSVDGEMDDYYEIMNERIGEYRLDPPGEDWDGVYVATTK